MKKDIIKQIDEILSILPKDECRYLLAYISELYSMDVKERSEKA